MLIATLFILTPIKRISLRYTRVPYQRTRICAALGLQNGLATCSHLTMLISHRTKRKCPIVKSIWICQRPLHGKNICQVEKFTKYILPQKIFLTTIVYHQYCSDMRGRFCGILVVSLLRDVLLVVLTIFLGTLPYP